MERKLKILFLSHSAGLNGAEKCLLTLLRHLNKDKFIPVALLPEEGPLKTCLEEAGIRVIVRPLLYWINTPDVEASKAKSEGLLLRAEGIASIVTVEGFDVVHTNTSVLAEGAIAARIAGKPHVWHLHEILEGHPSLKPLLPLYLVHRFFDLFSESVVAVSGALARSVSEDMSPGKVRIIINGIDVPVVAQSVRASVRKELGVPEEGIIVCTVGHILKEKGPSNFVEAAIKILRERDDVWFISVGGIGDSQLYKDLEERIAGEQGKIRFLGYRDDVSNIMSAIDIYVVSSKTESFSLSALEAMAAGKPIVATKCGGPEEIIMDGQTGLLVPVNDSDKMAKAVLSLINNSQERQRMGMLGKARFDSHYSAQRYCKNFEELYSSLKGKQVLSSADERLADSLVELIDNVNSAVHDKVAEKDRTIQALMGSMSWKVTAPLRSVFKYLR